MVVPAYGAGELLFERRDLASEQVPPAPPDHAHRREDLVCSLGPAPREVDDRNRLVLPASGLSRWNLVAAGDLPTHWRTLTKPTRQATSSSDQLAARSVR
jgi:hypothetical protein